MLRRVAQRKTQQQTGADGRPSSELQKVLLLEKKLATLSKVQPSTSTAPGESHSVVYDIFRNTEERAVHTSLDPSAIGEADGGNSDDSESSIDDSSQPDKSRETEALTSSPSLDLVITPCKERGTIQIIPWSTWRGRRDLV